MNHTKNLEDFEFTLDNPAELSSEDYADTVNDLLEYYEEHGDQFTDNEFAIYNRADLNICVGEEYYENIYRNEEAEEFRDQARYLSLEGNH